jgi:hypothetical protein
MTTETFIDSLVGRAIEGKVEALGSLYALLVRALDGQEDAAREGFRRYLTGETSPELLRLAHRQID